VGDRPLPALPKPADKPNSAEVPQRSDQLKSNDDESAALAAPGNTPATSPQATKPATMPAVPTPAKPTVGPSGSVAGFRAGPPASAFTPRLAPQGDESSSRPVGSGIASKFADSIPTAPARIAKANNAAEPQTSAPSADPTTPPPADPYAARTESTPNADSALGTLGNASLGTPSLGNPTASQTTLSPMRDQTAGSRRPAANAGVNSKSSFAASTDPGRSSSQQLEAGQTAVASELPGIRVVTHGPSSVIIRQTQQFEIRVENRGSIDAAGLMVRVSVPDWAEVLGQTASRGNIENQPIDHGDRLVWNVDTLPAGSNERMFVRLKAERSGKHGLDVDWTLVPQKSITTIQVREPKLDLLIEGPDEVVYGESQTYKVRVLNPGDGLAPNVVFTLSPDSPTPQSQRIGDIPSGKEAQFEVELTAQDLGDLKIHGLASGDLGLKAEADKTIRVAAAELEAILTGPALQYQNTDAVYHLQVNNNGSAHCKNVTAELSLPVGVEYLGGIDVAKQRGTTLAWQIDTLPPGAMREYEFQCAMNSPGEKEFKFAAKGTAAGNTAVALATDVESIADLVMTIQDPTAPAPVDSEVVYEIVIRNRGSREAKDVRAVAQFSHGIEPRRIEGQSGEVLTGQVLFDPITRIRPGEEVRLRVIAEADRPGHHRFRTETRSGETVLVAEEATHYMSRKVERVSRRSARSSSR